MIFSNENERGERRDLWVSLHEKAEEGFRGEGSRYQAFFSRNLSTALYSRIAILRSWTHELTNSSRI